MRLTLPNILVIAAIIVVGALGSAYITSWYFQRQAADVMNETASESAPRPGGVVRIENITADLRSPNRNTAFVRATVVLEVPDSRTAVELQERDYRLRDAIIAVLRSYSADEVEAEEGAERLKLEIKDAIDSLVNRGEVLGVFFHELVVQR